jgi:outer membrane protein assembly factor BamB
MTSGACGFPARRRWPRGEWWPRRAAACWPAGPAPAWNGSAASFGCLRPAKPLWERRYSQIHQPPLVDGGRVFATQPGVWGIQCLDLATGRLVWQRAAGDLVRLVGLAEDRLVVETAEGLSAFDAASGKPLWTHEAPHAIESRILAGPRAIEYLQTAPPLRGEAPQLALTRIDLDNGQVRRRTLLKGPAEKEPLWGPLVTAGGRQWLLSGAAANPTKRIVLELTGKDADGR